MEEDERRKIDLKQHALSPVSKAYLLRIIMYVVLLTGLSLFIFYLYNRKPEPADVKRQDMKVETDNIKEIRGVTLTDSL